MSSIIKSSFVSFSEDKKKIEVIDTNNNKILTNPLGEKKVQNVEDVLEHVQNVEDVEEPVTDINPLEYIDNARDEAEKIVQLAMEEANNIKEAAYKEGHDKGYRDGKRIATKEMNKHKQEIQHQYEQLEIDKVNLIKFIEPKVAEIVSQLVLSLIGQQRNNPETILFIVKKGLEEVDLKGDITIKVSSEDFQIVNDYRDEMVGYFSNKIDIEILKDAELNKNDCIIETDLGNIDCSLDSRLTGLLNELKLIGESI